MVLTSLFCCARRRRWLHSKRYAIPRYGIVSGSVNGVENGRSLSSELAEHPGVSVLKVHLLASFPDLPHLQAINSRRRRRSENEALSLSSWTKLAVRFTAPGTLSICIVISVTLQPVVGCDPNLKTNLEGFFRLNYPKVSCLRYRSETSPPGWDNDCASESSNLQ